MPTVFWQHIARADLQCNRQTLFVFGDNELRRGCAGQAAACRGEPNALGIATKRAPSMSESAFWRDDDFDRCMGIVDADLAPAFEHVRQGMWVVVPAAGVGTGRACLHERAPRIHEAIRTRFKMLVRLGRLVEPSHAAPVAKRQATTSRS